MQKKKLREWNARKSETHVNGTMNSHGEASELFFIAEEREVADVEKLLR
jgi:hypothetical protein